METLIFWIFRVLYALGFMTLYFAYDEAFTKGNLETATPWIYLAIGFIYIIAVRIAEMRICENPKPEKK